MKIPTTPHVGMPVFSAIFSVTSSPIFMISLPMPTVGADVVETSSVQLKMRKFSLKFFLGIELFVGVILN